MADRPARLYVHCPRGMASFRTRAGKEQIIRQYPERALLMAGARDLVCVARPIEAEYIRYLNQLGVGPAPENVLAVARDDEVDDARSVATAALGQPELLARIGRSVPPGAALDLHPYVVSDEIFALAEALCGSGTPVRVLGGDPAVVERADRKHLIRARAQALGVPVAPGEVVELPVRSHYHRRDLEPVRAAIERQSRRTGRAIVRGSSGSAGSSIFIAGPGGEAPEAIVAGLMGRTDNHVYLVESMVDVRVSPNLHFRIELDGTVTEAGASDQRWDRPLHHVGNVSPSTARLIEPMREWARALAGSLRDNGYVGDIGFDFVEHDDPCTGEPSAFLAEVNPRVNGSTYPLALAERLGELARRSGRPPIAAFASGILTTRARSFTRLRGVLCDQVCTSAGSAGIVPYMTGHLANGACAAVAFAPTREEALERFAAAQVALDAAWAAASCA